MYPSASVLRHTNFYTTSAESFTSTLELEIGVTSCGSVVMVRVTVSSSRVDVKLDCKGFKIINVRQHNLNR